MIANAETETRKPERLQTLARHARQAEKRFGELSWGDDLSHLSPEKRASWCRILSSVATTETLEESLMAPLQQAFRRNEEVSDYLESHAADEKRHFNILTRYLRNTFRYEKKKRTAMDLVLYDRVIPRIAALFRSRPAYGFALLYAYEKFSIQFYDRLRREAQNDGAQNLLTLLQSVEKDELRHVAGMEHLLRAEIARKGVSRMDLLAIRGILKVMLLDVDMSEWALHNREVRGHLVNLGFDTDAITAAARGMVAETLELIASARGSRDEDGVRNVH